MPTSTDFTYDDLKTVVKQAARQSYNQKVVAPVSRRVTRTKVYQFQNNRAHKWNQKHAHPIEMKPRPHVDLAKREKGKPFSSRRALYHGSANRHEHLKPSFSGESVSLTKGKPILWATDHRHIAESYALGNYGIQGKKNRTKGFVHVVERHDNKNFTDSTGHLHKMVGAFVTEKEAWQAPGLQNRRKRIGHSTNLEHSAYSTNPVSSKRGYWVHEHQHRISRYMQQPRSGKDQTKHDAKVAGAVVGAGAVAGAGYYGYKHRHEIAERAHHLTDRFHHSKTQSRANYYYRHQGGKMIRVKKGKR